MNRRWLLAFVAACGASPALEPAVPPTRPDPHVGIAENQSCIGCHPREADEWRGSLHQRAFTNAAFQQAFAIEPTRFCHDCHAPAKEDDGIACVSCHLDKVREGPSPSPSFVAKPDCARCHEFPFTSGGEMMQTTMREHVALAPDKACTSCHHGHSLAEVRDPAWLASSLLVSAAIVDGKARLTLTQTRAGHAFPTGDLFRRLSVTIGDETQYLARQLVIVPGHGGRQLASDNRVFGESVFVEASEPIARLGGQIHWSVRLDRVAQVGLGTNASNALVESSVVLHEGVLKADGGE